jgi:hypothetical protein
VAYQQISSLPPPAHTRASPLPTSLGDGILVDDAADGMILNNGLIQFAGRYGIYFENSATACRSIDCAITNTRFV